ncbi:MAG: hypothetical protein ACK5V3_05430, partial [Bdellovibrionales bacterium]
ALVEVISSHVNGGEAVSESKPVIENVVLLKKKPVERSKVSMSGSKASGSEYVPAANDPGFGEE